MSTFTYAERLAERVGQLDAIDDRREAILRAVEGGARVAELSDAELQAAQLERVGNSLVAIDECDRLEVHPDYASYLQLVDHAPGSLTLEEFEAGHPWLRSWLG